MLNLKLRAEFSSEKPHGTMVDFKNEAKTGALDISAESFLKITYPSIDLLHAIEAILPTKRRPTVLLGERGQGKSHLMAVLYHIIQNPEIGQTWYDTWKDRINHPLPINSLEKGFLVIAESLNSQNYNTLWDILFDKHPDGQYFRGKWDSEGINKNPIPSEKLILSMLEKKPVALILDEFQTWFEGRIETQANPSKTHAFNFIQILSEIATHRPDLLILVASVRDSGSDAAQQIYRINPARIAFNNPQTKKDRLRLILYRIFENRMNISVNQIDSLIAIHLKEYLRLKEIPTDKAEDIKANFLESWPYSHELIQMLEDQVLVAVNAQETRDLIRILVELFKNRGEVTPIITPADFLIMDSKSTAGVLLDSVASKEQRDLKEKAQRNLEALNAISGSDYSMKNKHEIITALWLRSLSVEKLKGAKASELHSDITKTVSIDDNSFQAELIEIEENSFNIHKEGERFLFKVEENPYSRVISSAKNEKLFTGEEDIQLLLKEMKYTLTEHYEVSNLFQIIPLGKDWEINPWQIEKFAPEYKFQNWDKKKTVIVVIPEMVKGIDKVLAKWLITHIPQKRNTIRFLLPKSTEKNYCFDKELILLTRVVYLCEKWGGEYKEIGNKYKQELRKKLKERFDLFAILENWDFQNPDKCKFAKEKHLAAGDKIPPAIENKIKSELYAREDFESLIMQFAKNGFSIDRVLGELQEPISVDGICLPWLGETITVESIFRLCAEGKIAINLKGSEMLQAEPSEDSETAYRRMKTLIPRDRDLETTKILLPDVNPRSQGIGEAPSVPDNPVTPPSEKPSDSPDIKNPFTQPRKVLRTKETLYAPPLHLINEIEKWNLADKETLQSISVRIEKMDKNQLRRMIEKLPDGFQYKIELDREELE
jgi:hypothetical protein